MRAAWQSVRTVMGSRRLASVALLSFSSGLPLGLVWLAVPTWMAQAGVEIKVIGQVSKRASFDVQKLAGTRLHTRTIIRDQRQAFIGSQSLRKLELDHRREVGVVIRERKAVKRVERIFKEDWKLATQPKKNS